MTHTHQVSAIDPIVAARQIEIALQELGIEGRIKILATGAPERVGRDEAPRLVLVQAAAPVVGVVQRLVSLWDEQPWSLCVECPARDEPILVETEFLVVAVNEQGSPEEFCWAGAEKNMPASVFRSECEIERSTIGARACIVVRASDNDRPEILSKAIDCILTNHVSLGLRPVEAASLHCIVPMEFKPVRTVNDRLDACRRATQADEQYNHLRANLLAAALKPGAQFRLQPDDVSSANYFLPHAHKLLAPNGEALRAEIESLGKVSGASAHTRLDEHLISLEYVPANWKIRAQRLDGSTEQCARLSRLRLHFYTARTIALEWQIEPDAILYCRDSPLWRRIFSQKGPVPTVAAWMDAVELMRMIYSAFVSKPDETGKQGLVTLDRPDCKRVSTPLRTELHAPRRANRTPIVGVVEALLRTCFEKQDRPLPELLEDWFELRTDDRARVVHGLAPAGALPECGQVKLELEALEARVRTVERHGRGHAYDSAFAKIELDRGAYDRFRSWGSRYLVSDHCFGFVGFGYFATDVVIPDHLPNIYRRMMILQLLNAAVLHGVEREVSEALEGWTPDATHDEADDKVKQAYERLEPRFAKFVNVNWFERISSQMQGVELFDLLRRESGLQREFNLVSDEIARTDRYLARIAEREEVVATRRAERDRQWIVLIGSLLAGIWTLTKALSETSAPGLASFIDWIVGPLGLPTRSKLAPIMEWKFEIAAMMMALVLTLLMWVGIIKAPGSTPRLRPSIPLVGAALAATIFLPLTLSRTAVTTPPGAALGALVALAALVFVLWWSSRPIVRGEEDARPLMKALDLERLACAAWARLTRRGADVDFLIATFELQSLRPDEIHDLRALRRAWLMFAGAAFTFVLIAGTHAAGFGRIDAVVNMLDAAAK